ncbi:DUF3445 domain-containing protein [Devosia sp. FJ2-5-3]|uniref:heme-dependent oxidative N-demethylase family protein n=1 Tax=Devosia sp. FJ2-5-3 TaxID=2976680 RepID=UPI0023D7C8E1|nr:DUF3445 domain-containing protein [Devosia sp. FJ2-5-3]WEJ58671.1 DUF3445 domain-containing protein [Devosia sp. FJ2-5-3]
MSRPFPDDGTARLFQIGTRPLDPNDWLAPDGALVSQLAEKARLRVSHPAEIFAQIAGSRPAQAELLATLADYLPQRFPALWRRDAEAISIVPSGQTIGLADPEAPLAIAARLVQDDLLLLERGAETFWRLTAASLSFPSSWTLSEKIGQGLDAIHDPVPGFGPGTRPAQIMARMFDAMRPETPMIRWNWSLYGDDTLFHPDVSGADQPRFGAGPRAENVYLRVERQVLRKLPETGAIVFAIRISLQKLDDLAAHPEAAAIAAHLHTEVSALTPEQLAYKGLARERDQILARLDEMRA